MGKTFMNEQKGKLEKKASGMDVGATDGHRSISLIVPQVGASQHDQSVLRLPDTKGDENELSPKLRSRQAKSKQPGTASNNLQIAIQASDEIDHSVTLNMMPTLRRNDTIPVLHQDDGSPTPQDHHDLIDKEMIVLNHNASLEHKIEPLTEMPQMPSPMP